MRFSEFKIKNEFPGLEKEYFMDRSGNKLKKEEVYRVGFDPEVLTYHYQIETGDLFVIFDVQRINAMDEKEEIHQFFREASKNLKISMEILQNDGFTREEAFELIKTGVLYIPAVSFRIMQSNSRKNRNL